MTTLRTAMAVAVGVCVAVLLWYLGLVVFVLATIGIPLGAQPRPLTLAEYVVLLLVAAAAAAIGSRSAARMARAHYRASTFGVSAILGVGMLWGFSGRNSWPDWWGPAMAVSMIAGACISRYVSFRK